MTTTSSSLLNWLKLLVASVRFIALRWETPFTPCTGITAVEVQERKVFCRRGIIIAPWQPRMKQAQHALRDGKVRETGYHFQVFSPNGQIMVRLLVSTDDLAPILFLAAEGYFKGGESPYDTQDLKADTLFFAEAVAALLAYAEASPSQFIWGADWEMVPALLGLKSRGHTTVLHIHNIMDEYLGDLALQSGYRQADQLLHRSVLKAGLKSVDVAVAVNRGYCHALRNELLYTRIMAPHLLDEVGRLIPIDNAAFEELTPELIGLEEVLARDSRAGLAALQVLKAKARQALPDELRHKVADKAFTVLMGRRTSQKGHSVAVSAIRQTLRKDRDFPAFFFFATTAGDETSAARLQRIVELCQEFPDHCAYSDGRLTFYNQLMAAADFNCMPSLGEPHGGAFQATVIPIARAVDGLAAQICAHQPTGESARLNAFWHGREGLPCGFTFREPPLENEHRAVEELRDLLTNETPAPHNETFRRMAACLGQAVQQAVEIHLCQPEVHAQLVLGALRAQMNRTWEMNLGGIFALVDSVRNGHAITSLRMAA